MYSGSNFTKSKYAVLKSVILCAVILFSSSVGYGQQFSLKDALLNYKSISDSTIKKYPAEKLYLQLNKPDYAIGDTIWYKTYIFNAPTLALSAKSGILYVTLSNDSSSFIKQYRLPVKLGLTWGNISLAGFPAGNYTLHAYTTWMRNFGPDCFFTKKFKMASEKAKVLTTTNFNDTIKLKRLLEPIQARQLKQAQEIDIQFMPEGGSLIAGLPAHIGFKAVGPNGIGVSVKGIITDNENREITSFNSIYKGMGSFGIALKSNEHYAAKVTMPDGRVKEYRLPEIKTTGTVLNVINPADKDSVTITISATNDIMQNGGSYFLVGKARNIVCYAAVLNFNNGNSIKKSISKSLFPSGITHFMLMTVKNQPLNERLIFINHADNLHIETANNKTFYNPHDSVAMQLMVSDATGKPVTGNFSISVTNDAQVNIDSLQDNIISHMLLTADVKGNLEQPAYYLQDNAVAWLALDNLLLTQGWVSYDLPENLPAPLYAAENGFAVNGRVVNGLHNSFKGVKVSLLSKSPLLIRDTLSDGTGRFSFSNFPQIDTPAFILKAVNRHGKSFNVGIVMDDEQLPVFTKAIPNTSTDTITDIALFNTAKNNRIHTEQEYLSPNGQLLKEVKIKAQKTVKGSQNLNGPGNADLVIDEDDLEKEGKKTWLDVLSEKVPGFKVSAFTGHNINDAILSIYLVDGEIGNDIGSDLHIGHFNFSWFFIKETPVKFLVDGVPVGLVYSPNNFYRMKNYLESQTAEDIKGIEVMNSVKFGDKYTPNIISAFNVGYIEITTRSGHGPVIDNTPGAYLYKPLPLSWPKQFYKPKYVVTDTVKHQPDARSAIDWEPNIITDAHGIANTWFYTADKSATYTIIIEGCDDSGNLGYKMSKIVIKPKGSN
jgi:hypothetical protein